MAKQIKTKQSVTSGSGGLFDKIENWANKNDQKLFFGLVLLTLFLTFISFNARISEAHDDALYLEGGWRFVNEFPNFFYTQNAPLYPMFLAILIKLIGFKLIVFKLVSSIFNLFGFVLFYKAIRHRLPAVVFLPVIIFQACNYLIIYYASMTFTEAFYFLLQGFFFYMGVQIIDVLKTANADLKTQWKTWLLLGLSMFLISTLKSSAVVVLPAVLLFFAVDKNWKAAGFSLGSYLIFKVPYELLVKSIWHADNQFKGQSKILLQKDPYDAGAGQEDMGGFIVRFIENINLSLSKRFYQLLGWKDEFNSEVNGYIAIITLAIALFGFWQIVKDKRREMLLFSLFTGAQLALSFVILQVRWDQARITLVGMPIVLALMFYGLYAAFGQKKWYAIYMVIAVLVSGSVVMSSFKRGFANLPIIKKNIKGDKFYGYTPDWQNFLKCSEWCADSLPENSLVASRKAPMSFVYGHGKKFFPVYSVIQRDTATRQSNPDSALAYFEKNKVTHVMLASLRANPKDPSMGVINTIHHILYPIFDKYPQRLRLVHTEGMSEECQVFEFVYH
jgi:hypothetical protein